MKEFVSRIQHNVSVLASLGKHQSVRLRTECGLLQHEMRHIPAVARMFTGDSRVTVLQVVDTTIDGVQNALNMLKDVRPNTPTFDVITALIATIRPLVMDMVIGIETLQTSHYHGDVTVELIVQRALSRIQTLFPEQTKPQPPPPPPPPSNEAVAVVPPPPPPPPPQDQHNDENKQAAVGDVVVLQT